MGYSTTIVYVLEILIGLYFGFAAIYVFVFSLAGRLGGQKKRAVIESKNRKYAVLIPGYKEDNVIVEVANKALEQHYPKEFFDVVVIADSFKAETLSRLRQLDILLIEVNFEQSTKSKALNSAMAELGDDYDIALVLDADNIMAPNFIAQFNMAFDQGYKVVQGHRVAKNTNTSFAVLDAISEEINNHIFRKGHRALGLSSALIGSGMAFHYHFFKNMMSKVNAIGGFDKELELKLLRDKETIGYLHGALIYDEKVQKSEVFANQRKRWLSAQFVYFRRFIGSGIKELFLRGNIDFFDKVYQMIAPPRVLLAGLLVLFALGHFLLYLLNLDSDIFRFSFQYWSTMLILVIIGFLMAIPSKFYSKATLIALFTLPKAFLLLFLSLFKLKGANKKFIHTQHGTLDS